MFISDSLVRKRLTRRQLYRWCGWFALANAVLAAALALRYLGYANPPATWGGWGFFALMLPGHFLILTFLLYPLAILPVLVKPWRGIFAYVVALYTIGICVILVDVQVFALYRFHLNGMVWNLLVSGVADEILPFTALEYFYAGSVVVAVAAGETLLAWLVWRWVKEHREFYGWRIALGLFGVVLAGQAVHAWGDATLYTPVTRQMQFMPFIRGTTAKGVLANFGWVPDAHAAARSIPRGKGNLAYPLEPLVCNAEAPLPNLLFLIVDGLRADALTPKASPNLWHFSQSALRFSQHISTGNSTRYGIFGLMYGLYGTYWDSMLAEQRGSVLIDEALRRQYRFAVFASASLRHPEFDRTVFAKLRGDITLDTEGPGSPERDERITEKFLGFLKESGDRPFFGWMFYDSPHAFAKPKDFVGPFAPELEGNLNHMALSNDFDPVPFANTYLNSVNYVDGLAGQVLAAMQAKGLLDNTIVIITGDHGEEFNDNKLNYWGHNGNFSPAQTHVPLVVHWPGRGSHDYGHVTSHADVVPTLMQDVFGCTTPIDQYSNGRSLFDDSPRPYVVASNYGGMAVIEPDRITAMDFYGRIEILNKRYRPLPKARLSTAYLQTVLSEMGRFYGR